MLSVGPSRSLSSAGVQSIESIDHAWSDPLDCKAKLSTRRLEVVEGSLRTCFEHIFIFKTYVVLSPCRVVRGVEFANELVNLFVAGLNVTWLLFGL